MTRLSVRKIRDRKFEEGLIIQAKVIAQFPLNRFLFSFHFELTSLIWITI